MNMLFYKFVSAILIIKLCESSSLYVVPDTELDNSLLKEPNKDARSTDEDIEMRKVLKILNPNTDGEEYNNEEIVNYFGEKVPKITIWTFPTERRVFFGDVEIFVDSKETEDLGEEIAFRNEKLLHPHRSKLPDETIVEAHEIPPFRSRHKESDINKHSIGDVKQPELIRERKDKTAKNLLMVNRNRRNINNKELEVPNIKDEVAVNAPRERTKRTFYLYDFLEWLLDYDDYSCESSEEKETKVEHVEETKVIKTEESVVTQVEENESAELQEENEQSMLVGTNYAYSGMNSHWPAFRKHNKREVESDNGENIPKIVDTLHIGNLFAYLTEFLQNNKENIDIFKGLNK